MNLFGQAFDFGVVVKRRDFIVGTALSLGLAKAHAQTSTSLPRLGLLLASPPSQSAQSRPGPLIEALATFGWIEGKTIQIDRLYIGDPAQGAATMEARAREMVALKPDVIFTATSPAVDAARRATTTIPVVFVGVNDPLAAGFVSSLAHPGGNITGFANYEPSAIGKMMALLKEVAPRTQMVALMYSNRYTVGDRRDWIIPREIMIEAARTHGVRLIDTPLGDTQEFDRTFAKLAEDQTTSVLIQADGYFVQNRDQIVSAAARNHVPTIYPFSVFVSAGGLMSYGINIDERVRQAAGYVDRILRGAHPADLPVQMPTKYEFVINMKVANALGTIIPPQLLSTADEVIE
jgi:putative ABC transport system substrate-binding protein